MACCCRRHHHLRLHHRNAQSIRIHATILFVFLNYLSFIHRAACLLFSAHILSSKAVLFFIPYSVLSFSSVSLRTHTHTHYLIIMNVIVSHISSLLFLMFNLASLRIIFCAFRGDECAFVVVIRRVLFFAFSSATNDKKWKHREERKNEEEKKSSLLSAAKWARGHGPWRWEADAHFNCLRCARVRKFTNCELKWIHHTEIRMKRAQ